MIYHIPNGNSVTEVIGLVPAGGQATRLAPLPCSKELYPIGFRRVGGERSLRVRPVCHCLLEGMQLAGITKAYIVLRKGKWDIPTYLGDGSMLDMHLGYLIMNLPYGVPYTLDQAYPFVQDALVALGFPDIVFEPAEAFVHLLTRQTATSADVVLGMFPADQPRTADVVDLDEEGRVRRILVKPRQTDLRYAWILAVWTPAFTRFMHEHLAMIHSQSARGDVGSGRPEQRELHVGDVIQAALEAGLYVDQVLFPSGSYLDIGIPDNLVQAVRDGVARIQ